MILQMLEHWRVVVDGIQITLCLLILLMLLRNPLKSRQPDGGSAENEHAHNFNSQVYAQTIRQQSEQAFDNISKTITAERRIFEEVLKFAEMMPETRSALGSQNGTRPSGGSEMAAALDGDGSCGDRLKKIETLAGKGWEARQISDALKMPLGEVEFILNLKKAESRDLIA